MKKEYDFSRAKRGPVVPVPPGKTRITIRLDNDILDWFKRHVQEAGGGNYQTLINAALHKYISARTEPPRDDHPARDSRRTQACELEGGRSTGTTPHAIFCAAPGFPQLKLTSFGPIA